MSYLYVAPTHNKLSATLAAIIIYRIKTINPSKKTALFSTLSVSSLQAKSSLELLVLLIL